MENRIAGKVVAITGASSGIGQATAEVLAAMGAKVVLGARRDDHLERIVEKIQQNGGEAAFLAVDVTRREDLTGLTELAVNKFGKLDVMINNAGISQLYPMEDIDVEGWEQMIDVNLKGTLYGIAAAMPIFKEAGSGHFINVIPTAGITIVPVMGVYAGTKNAVRTISEGLRQESQGRWRVTGVSPGYVSTEFAGKIKNDALRANIQKNAEKMAIPAEAIARAIAYAIDQPDNVDVGDIVIRPAVQS
ncbi:SDR family oxidoreductase [Mucilaginibacter pedocola]|uniref:Oxidoreductase n=1 Tax=Mucilaginibacter pedocola TaxID=1792845 RepID=A0A1S9PAD1_9SPHI|nr:SDR family oxidoreductase [Mucilaginibacter pedocola]OOQ57889.1 oxidoreductase [Mucilaginibacter pedocola]OOQ58389.1 oxidoreductase [Mucilaginibacter pedocola]OOQ58397.1 oxidoreductase [Mucilaginibacter pedocola]OOQ60436.1 oxidoreductase [Mucilaginibacter pedocola]